MKVLGITGGVGAGKSTVLDYMKETYGAVILQADLAARLLMQKGTDCYEKIVTAFGRDILDEEEQLDRVKMAAVVFADQVRLKQLNEIVHPAVKAYILDRIREEREGGACRVMAIEAALLIEEGYGAICDELWYIYASEAVRRERLKTTRGYSDARIDGIFKSQCPEEVFRANCAVTIDTGISLAYTKQQVDTFLKERITD